MTSVETTITSILDIIPTLKKKKYRKYISITVICLVQLLFGLTYTFNSGTYWIGCQIFIFYILNFAIFEYFY